MIQEPNNLTLHNILQLPVILSGAPKPTVPAHRCSHRNTIRLCAPYRAHGRRHGHHRILDLPSVSIPKRLRKGSLVIQTNWCQHCEKNHELRLPHHGCRRKKASSFLGEGSQHVAYVSEKTMGWGAFHILASSLLRVPIPSNQRLVVSRFVVEPYASHHF